MRDVRIEAVEVAITGLLRGVDLDGRGTAALTGDALVITLPRACLTIRAATLDGLRLRDRQLELYAHTGDFVHLSARSGLEPLARALLERACAIPEMTLSLRGLGSHRAHPDSDHDAFFAPLLQARRHAERTAESERKLASFDAAKLRAAIERQLFAFAASRSAGQAPDRRAMEAELLEHAEDLFRRLGQLEAAKRSAVACAPESRLLAWREWASSVHHVFESADACWLAIQPVLSASSGAPPRGWRRWLRRGSGS